MASCLLAATGEHRECGTASQTQHLLDSLSRSLSLSLLSFETTVSHEGPMVLWTSSFSHFSVVQLPSHRITVNRIKSYPIQPLSWATLSAKVSGGASEPASLTTFFSTLISSCFFSRLRTTCARRLPRALRRSTVMLVTVMLQESCFKEVNLVNLIT